MVKGKIHSIESMGLVDGPGIRTVVFFHGCRLRCAYCHNPDTWSMEGGEEVEAEELLKKIKRYKPYFEKSGGGVTFSGGEVLLQPQFLLEVLKLCKREGIHTTIDTAGYGYGDYDEILKYTDLAILDIKHRNNEEYKNLTGQNMKGFMDFVEAAEKAGTKLWIRHVVVPNLTDSISHIEEIGKIIKGIKNVEKVELLPYHTLGNNKYEKIGIKNRLENTKDMDTQKCKELEKYLISIIK